MPALRFLGAARVYVPAVVFLTSVRQRLDG